VNIGYDLGELLTTAPSKVVAVGFSFGLLVCQSGLIDGKAPSTLAAESAVAEGPNIINSARVLMRTAEESGPYHNFPGSFDAQILQQGTRTVTPNFYNVASPLLSNDAVMYELRGSINGVEGTFQIGTRPSVSGNTELIMHRFFSPDW
jgi:hypothetical protein